MVSENYLANCNFPKNKLRIYHIHGKKEEEMNKAQTKKWRMPGQRTKGKRIGSHQDDEMSRTRHWLAGNVKAKMGQSVTRLDASHSHVPLPSSSVSLQRLSVEYSTCSPSLSHSLSLSLEASCKLSLSVIDRCSQGSHGPTIFSLS